MISNVPLASLSQLGKTKGWRKLFNQYADELGDAFVPGKMDAITLPTRGVSSRGFAGTTYRNPLQPDFAASGPRVSASSAEIAAPQGRARYVATGTRNEAAEAQKAIRAEHVDSSNLGKLKRLLATREGQLGAAGLGGLGIGGAGMAAMGGGEEVDPELLQLLAARGML